jgi:hypothetical protein
MLFNEALSTNTKKLRMRSKYGREYWVGKDEEGCGRGVFQSIISVLS